MSVRPQNLCTLKLENGIIECGFFCLKAAYRESKFRNFRSERTKIKPNEIFTNFAISREPLDEIDLNPTGPDRTKLEPNKRSSTHILVFKLNNQLKFLSF